MQPAGERLSYRERRLAKAERLRGWADGRKSKSVAVIPSHTTS